MPDARLTYYGKREATLISGGLGYLDPIWKNDHWTLYRVADADPDRRVARHAGELNADSITFTAPAEQRRPDQRPLAAAGSTPTAGGCLHRRDGDTVALPDGRGTEPTHVARFVARLRRGHCS